MTVKRHKEFDGGGRGVNGKILYFVVLQGVCICQNTLNCMLKTGAFFIESELNLTKVDF